jgi:hypothetical protein
MLWALILPATLNPGDYSGSNRNEYRSRKIMFLGSRVWLGLKEEEQLEVLGNEVFGKCLDSRRVM